MRTEQPHWFTCSVVTLTESECMDILRGNQIGRIVFEDEAGPVALPVNYAVVGDDVVIRTVPDGSIARNAGQQRVAFEVDEIDDYTESGSSVVVRGKAMAVLNAGPQSDGEPSPWAEGDRSCIIRILPHTVTGRRLVPR